MRSLTVDLDGPVHVADFGGDGLPIVLVHGLGGSHVDWLAVGPGLAGRGRVLALDLAGHGLTPLHGRSASIPANTELLDRFLETVVGEPSVLIGNSMGGLISLLEASAAPQKIAGMVLVDPAVPPAPGTPADPVVEQLFTAYDTPGMGEVFLAEMKKLLAPEIAYQQVMEMLCGDASRVPAYLAEAEISMAREQLAQPWSDAAFLEASRSLLRYVWHEQALFEGALDRVTAPTLWIHGALDRLVQLSAAEEIIRRRPDWTLEVFPTVGHVPMMETPDDFLLAVSNWLDGILPAMPAGSTAGGGIPSSKGGMEP